MPKTTITEVLAEIKLIGNKVAKKQEFILNYLMRQNNFVDPLGDSGGSRKVLESELQAVTDLLSRKVLIRKVIHFANANSELTLGGETRLIADWLVWRREVAPLEKILLDQIRAKIAQGRQQAANAKIGFVAADKTPEGPSDLLVNLSERKVCERAEKLQEVLDQLDGQLSLKNATTYVEF